MNAAKADFLQNRFVPLLQQLAKATPPLWGKMTVQQMIEHFADALRTASGAVLHNNIVTPPEQLDKMRSFLESDKPFRQNTLNPLMPATPAPVRNPSKDDAIKELKKELDYFFDAFKKNPLRVTRNPFFGDLTYEQNVQLLYKHAQHHLRQFGSSLSTEGGT